MSNYIKVTEDDKQPFVTLRQNELFYKKRGAKIEEPTQEEIEKCFPEEKQTRTAAVNSGAIAELAAAELAKIKEELDALQKELDGEKAAHAETKAFLKEANAFLKEANAELVKGKTKKPKKTEETYENT